MCVCVGVVLVSCTSVDILRRLICVCVCVGVVLYMCVCGSSIGVRYKCRCIVKTHIYACVE